MKWVAATVVFFATIFFLGCFFVFGCGVRDPFHGNIATAIVIGAIALGAFFGTAALFDKRTTGTVVGPPSLPRVTDEAPPPRSPAVRPHKVPPLPNRGSSASSDADDSAFYAAAMKECDGGQQTRRFGLWAKAFSMAEGDENRARAKYIELRAAELISEDRKQRMDVLAAGTDPIVVEREYVMTPEQVEFATRHPVGQFIPLLAKTYGYRMTRVSGESDTKYAARLARFVDDYERTTGAGLGKKPQVVTAPTHTASA